MGQDLFLHGLPVDLIEAAYRAAPGNEIESGKFASPESSAALVANTFGLFLEQPARMPALPGTENYGWPALSITLEGIVRFPWSGGRHPCLDVLISTSDALIGLESKRFEPFRSKGPLNLSKAYWRPVWGDRMAGYERVRDGLMDGVQSFLRLDAQQLIKHAFGLRTAAHQAKGVQRKHPILFYLYAEPETWPGSDRPVTIADRRTHQDEIARFAALVSGSEVEFMSCSYETLLSSWAGSASGAMRAHSAAVRSRFAP